MINIMILYILKYIISELNRYFLEIQILNLLLEI